MLESDPKDRTYPSTASDEQPTTNLSHLPPRRGERAPESPDADTEPSKVIELREEQLTARKDLVDLGEVIVRTAVDEVPGRLEVDALREEVEIEHIPVGRVVSERGDPREEDGTLIIPIYEEQLVVTKRLVLREELRVRRIGTTEHQVFEDTLRKERLVVEDPDHTGMVHELFPRDDAPDEHENPDDHPGLLERVVRKTMG